MSSMHPTFEHEECPSDFSGESPGKVASLAPFPFFTSQYSRYANMVSLGLLMCTLADLLGTGFWVQVGLKERSFAAPFFYLQNGDFQAPRAATSYQYLFPPANAGMFWVPICLCHSSHAVMNQHFEPFQSYMHLTAGNPEQHNSPRIYNRRGHFLRSWQSAPSSFR